MPTADGAVRLAKPLSREELDRAFDRFGAPESGRRLALAVQKNAHQLVPAMPPRDPPASNGRTPGAAPGAPGAA